MAMIRQAAERREANSLRANNTFQYIQYQKISALVDTFSIPMFLNESVTEVAYQQPDKHHATVIASRTSGFQDPIISVWLASQQSVYFDEDDVQLLRSNFLNPLSLKGLNSYDYALKEKIVHDGDTLFRITFQPKKGRHGAALYGNVWLHYPDWALQRIQASATDSATRFPLTIDYRFQPQANGTWAPDTVTFQIRLQEATLQNVPIVFHSISTFQQLQLNPTFSKKRFGRTDVKDSLSNAWQNELLLSRYRSEPLSAEERRTYELVDSISRAANLDRSFDMLGTMAEGCIPIGPVNLDIAKLVQRRNVEGWRFGLGFYTNDRISRHFSLGGHFAYALGDHRWKGLVRTDFNLHTDWDLQLRLEGGHEFVESSSIYRYDVSQSFLSSEYVRQWTINHYDYITQLQGIWQMRPFKWLRTAINVRYGLFETGYNYHFQPWPKTEDSRFYFQNFEAGITLRLAFREQQIQSGKLTLYEESPFPVITFHYAKGFKNVIHSDFDYHKMDLNIRYRKEYHNNGYTEVSLWGGYTPDDLPAPLLYTPMAAYATIDFDSWEQFATMRSNAFLCDKYAFVFLRHNFGKITNNRRFSPQIILCQNMGIGGLRHPELHQDIDFEDLSRGYFETGIILDRLINLLNFSTIGVGLFYHYGPYYQPKAWDNFAIKIRFSIL